MTKGRYTKPSKHSENKMCGPSVQYFVYLHLHVNLPVCLSIMENFPYELR